MDMVKPRRGPRVLIVEDNRAVCRLLSLVIRRRGYTCDLAGSVEEARFLLRKEDYGILILDFTLPDGVGINILKDRLEFASGAVYLIITGSDDLDIANLAARNGVYDVIAKPFTLALFEERLSEVVEIYNRKSASSMQNDHNKKPGGENNGRAEKSTARAGG